MEETFFVYREPESAEELKSTLLLRASVYMESRFHNFRDKFPNSEIELDAFDLRARHYGLFMHKGGQSRAVGYLRVVLDEETPWAATIREIALTDPALTAAITKPPSAPFPLMTYIPDATIAHRNYLGAKGRGRSGAEVGRLSLEKSVRSLSNARNMVSSAAAVAIVQDIDDVYITCVPNHSRFYMPYGFEVCPGTSQSFCEETGTELVCLHGSPEAMTPGIRPTILAMADAFFRTGRICFNPACQDNFFAPMRTYVDSRPRLSAAA